MITVYFVDDDRLWISIGSYKYLWNLNYYMREWMLAF